MQREDHKSFDASGGTTAIPMQSRGADPWDARPSMDSLTANAAPHASVERARTTTNPYGHLRQDSGASVATMLTEKPVEAARYDYGGSSHPTQPAYAYTQEPEPTPYYQNSYYGAQSGGVSQPERVQAHPGASIAPDRL
jgi:hypothetical protein